MKLWNNNAKYLQGGLKNKVEQKVDVWLRYCCCGLSSETIVNKQWSLQNSVKNYTENSAEYELR